jgi:DNA-directed RNA polymerase specialized sigma24 family protein
MSSQAEFVTLYKEQRRRLIRLAHRFGVSPNVADEIVQESFEALWHKILDGEKIESNVAFLVTVTKNKTFNMLKSAQHRQWIVTENFTDENQRPISKSDREKNEKDRKEYALEKARNAASSIIVGDVKVTSYPAVEIVDQSETARLHILKSAQSIDDISSQEFLKEDYDVESVKTEDFGSERLREKCVTERIDVFEQNYPEAGYAIKMQLDGIEIAKIAEAINRSAEATRQYLYQIRKKLKDYLIECKEY